MLSYSNLRKQKRADGTLSKFYYIREYNPATKASRWVPTRCTSKKAAAAYVHRLELAARDPDLALEMEHQGMTFAAALDSWLDAKDGGVVSTAYLEIMRGRAKLWRADFGKLALRAVDAGAIRAHLATRRKSVKPATVNTELRHLRALFTFAIDQGWLSRNPAKGIQKFTGVEKRERWGRLTGDQEARLLLACSEGWPVEVVARRNRGGRAGGTSKGPRVAFTRTATPPECLRIFILTALRTGFRMGTLLRLQWRHIDIKAKSWRVPGELFKTNREYSAPAMPSLLAELRAYKATLSLDRQRPRSPIFGLTPTADISKHLQAAVRRAGGLDGFTLHDCRRCFVNTLVDADVPLDTAMQLSQHMDIRVVLEHYRKASEPLVRKGLVAADAFLAAR